MRSGSCRIPFVTPWPLPRLYEYKQSGDIVKLFHKTPLEQSRTATSRVAAIGSKSPMLSWLSEDEPRNRGMILAIDALLEEIMVHLRSLLLVWTDENDAILQVWDGSVLSRICSILPGEIPVFLGPVRRMVTRTHTRSLACIDRDGEAFMEAPRRLRQFRLSNVGKEGPGMRDEKRCHLGDGTVPLSSATGLDPDCNTWAGATACFRYGTGPPATYSLPRAVPRKANIWLSTTGVPSRPPSTPFTISAWLKEEF